MSFHSPRRGSTSGSETSSRASSPHFILPSQPRFSPPFRAGSTPPETPSSSQSMFMSLSHKVEFKHSGTSNFSCIFYMSRSQAISVKYCSRIVYLGGLGECFPRQIEDRPTETTSDGAFCRIPLKHCLT